MLTAPSNVQTLEESLNRLVQALDALMATLEAERDAIGERSLNRLEQATSQKIALLKELEHQGELLVPATLQRCLHNATAQEREKLEQLHKAARNQAQVAKDFNTVNGKILARSQQSIAALTNLLRADSPDVTYGEQGKVTHGGTGTTQGRLAKA